MGLAFWLWLSTIYYTGWIAGEKGRSPPRWMFLAAITGPLAMIAVGLAPSEVPETIPQRSADPRVDP